MNYLKIFLWVLSLLLVISRLYIRYRYMRWKSKLRYREQLLLSLIGVAIAGAVVGGLFLWRSWYYAPAPAPYATMGQAEADGCVVIHSPGFLERGQERWDQFFGMTNMGIPDAVSIAVWDGGESQVVNTILYDGTQYHYTTHNGLKHSDSVTTAYPYLLHLTYEPPEDSDQLYTRSEQYVLTDKADLTGEELANRLYGDNAAFHAVTIICAYTWKDSP